MVLKLGRRSLFLSLFGAGVTRTISPGLAGLVQTPRQSEGPFYPRPFERFDDIDNNLVAISGNTDNALGKILHLSGQVVTVTGEILSGVLVEIWQCDANGRYMHNADRSPTRRRDMAFQGYGKTLTDQAGKYNFRTIRPVAYPGRTPHIHFKVSSPSGRTITTQMYLAREPDNARDFLYNSLSPMARQAVTISLTKQNEIELSGKFVIVL